MKEFQFIIDEVQRYLAEDSHNEARIIERIKRIQKRRGPKLYQALLYILTHLEFSEEDATIHWNRILAHREEMSKRMEREVGLRVAMCDYFFNINRELENPIIIEIEVFEATERLSHIDGLTGLYNRRYFDIALAREIARAKRYDNDLSLLFLDIDHFKRYNDTHGHLAGDEVLKTLAGILQKNKRLMDIAARYGGEEFILILPKTTKSGAFIFGERLRKKVSLLKPSEDGSGLIEPITISGGIASFPQDTRDQGDLILKADEALYHAKRRGRNRINLFSTEKRTYVRVPISVQVHYKILDPEEGSLERCRSVDIGEGGILLKSSKLIPLSSMVRMSFQIPYGRKVRNFLGIVVNINPTMDETPYLIGISFLRMETDTRKALSRYIRRKIGAAEKA